MYSTIFLVYKVSWGFMLTIHLKDLNVRAKSVPLKMETVWKVIPLIPKESFLITINLMDVCFCVNHIRDTWGFVNTTRWGFLSVIRLSCSGFFPLDWNLIICLQLWWHHWWLCFIFRVGVYAIIWKTGSSMLLWRRKQWMLWSCEGMSGATFLPYECDKTN